MLRLTKDTVEKILAANEGFTAKTYYHSGTERNEKTYFIKNGIMYMREVAGEEPDAVHKEAIAIDLFHVRRILKKFEDKLTVPYMGHQSYVSENHDRKENTW